MSYDLMSMTKEELSQFILSIGEPSYRATQIFKWAQSGTPIDKMTNLSKALREKLLETTENRLPNIKEKYISKIDGTIKYLFELIDGELIETVFMKYKYGNTICISTQCGCRMGCKFCASTLHGLSRNLYPSEMLGQITAVQNDTGERVSGVVMMGIGEPLDNYDNSIKFLRLVSDPDGIGIGLRHISLSTCGIVPGIKKLSDEGLPITLSLSLHASNNEERKKIMPIANKYPLDVVLDACKMYFLKTGRRISFEYTLINGENDSEQDAVDLALLIKKRIGKIAHINLILLNQVEERNYKTPDRIIAEKFMDVLIKNGINATIRRKLGSDINASCGQLRHNSINEQQI